MRFRSITGVATIGAAVLAIGLPGVAGVHGRTPATPLQHRAAGNESRSPSARSRTATGQCSSNSMTGFLGVGGASTVAAGFDSAVLGGTNNEACDDYTGIGAGEGNNVGNTSDATVRSFIGGGQNNSIGQMDAFIGAGESNSASYTESAVVTGSNNTSSGYASLIGAGESNSASGASSSVSGGDDNAASGDTSFIGGGYYNAASGLGSAIGGGGAAYANLGGSTVSNSISGSDSFVGAGDQNTIASIESFIGSGSINSITTSASYASILGGNRNVVTGEYASILGGFGNSATGPYAIVAGGDADSAAGTLTFAAGYHADAVHGGSFVWSDFHSGSAVLKDTAANQFVVRASGGTMVYSNEATTSGVKLAAGGGSWASLSDRNAKTGVVPLDEGSVLAKVAALRVSAWRYKTENGVRHVGPMAQDFYAAFGLGEDDRHITSIDEDGVALAAIKALYEDNQRLRCQNRTLQSVVERNERHRDGEFAALRSELRHLEAAVAPRVVASRHRLARESSLRLGALP